LRAKRSHPCRCRHRCQGWMAAPASRGLAMTATGEAQPGAVAASCASNAAARRSLGAPQAASPGLPSARPSW
jgi:hypothetical protein